MNDMDMIFLFQQYLEETDLTFLEGIDRKVKEKKQQEEEEKEEDQNE